MDKQTMKRKLSKEEELKALKEINETLLAILEKLNEIQRFLIQRMD